jgi:serine protease Do
MEFRLKCMVLQAILAASVVLITSGYAIGAEGGASAVSKEFDPQQELVEKAIDKMKPSLVRLHVVWTDFESGREIKYEAYGSGAIITAEGHVVTNHHVAGRARQIFCTLFNKDEVEADLVGTDPLTDISVVKMRPMKKGSYTPAAFGDSSKLRVGETVLAMGSPLALSQSVTKGIVSNTEMIQPRVFGPFKLKMEGEDVGSIVRWIGHDAPIYGGNSGGPLVNLAGEIVGINEISLGLSGAIPGNLAKNVADQLIKTGRVARAWLGIEVQPLLEAQRQKPGILVAGAMEGSPAGKAGFKPGDILEKLAGKEVSARFQEEIPIFNQYVQSLVVGKEVTAVVFRDGRELTLKVTPVEREEVKPKPRELIEWGMTARNISMIMAHELLRSSQDGVLVTSLRQGGPCSEAKPRIGEKDVITAVNGKSVKNLEELIALSDKLLAGVKDAKVPVLVAFDHDDERYLTVVEIGSVQPENPGAEIKKAWLPLSYQVLTAELAAKLGFPGKKGVRVTEVYPVKEAQAAGFKVGDLLFTLDGDEIPIAQPEDYEILLAMIRQYKIGSKVKFGLVRDGKPASAELVLAGMPLSARELKRYRSESFEFEARDISFADRLNSHWPDSLKGAMMDEVTQGGWAAIGQLAGGDLVLELNGRPVEDVTSLKKIMTEIERDKPSVIVVHVLRRIHHVYLELKPGWPKK